MSYDVCLIDKRPACTCCGRDEEESETDVGNYTDNVAGMWEKALGHSLSDLDGQTAGNAISPLEVAVARMTHPPEVAGYRAMNPPNGWGSYEGAVGYLRAILAECRRQPNAVIRISH